MLASNLAKPGFGAKLRTPEFYATVNQTLSVMRDKATLRAIAQHLNNQGLTTPGGLPWTRSAVSNYIRQSAN
jgi:hypothetical protein